MNRYFKEVIDTHDLIRRWLGDVSTPQKVYEILISRFSPSYTMVTPDGSQLDHAALNTFFRTQRGSLPGIEINIENMQLIAESITGATVTYQERQQFPGQSPTLRYSTVVFELGQEGQVIWRHLHETLLP